MYLSLDSSAHGGDKRAFVTKLKIENLFGKLDALEKELMHYKKLKRRWNRIKNLLHCLKYPVCALMFGGYALLLFTGVGAPIAIASSGVTLFELAGSHLVKQSVVRAKVNKNAAKVAHIKEWIDRMYVLKSESLRD